MPVGLLNVVWIYDDFIRPPGPKMVACVEPAMGFFFRINSEPKWQEPVLIALALGCPTGTPGALSPSAAP